MLQKFYLLILASTAILDMEFTGKSKEESTGRTPRTIPKVNSTILC